jgi:rubrerythrin
MDRTASAALSPRVAAAIAWSLARFQIGEVGEGRVVAAVARSTMSGIDDDYRAALALFIREEGRHAAILASCVRALGGQLLATTWTERSFVRVRRLAGIRFKLLAMFAAEVVGIGFYGALAGSLPAGPIRGALEQIAADERAHLAFHRWFFTLQAPRGWRRALFLACWFSLAPAAALVVLIDHRRTLRTLGVPVRTMASRLWSLVIEGAR